MGNRWNRRLAVERFGLVADLRRFGFGCLGFEGNRFVVRNPDRDFVGWGVLNRFRLALGR